MMFPSDLLAGRVAIVTGAGRGIGRAIADALAAAGADVWLNARSEDSVAELAETLTQRYSGTARPLVFDAGNPADIKSGFADIQKQSKRLDILVNNAGVLHESLIEMATLDSMEDSWAVNLRAPIICSQYAARLMARAGGGSIINIASIIGRVGNPGQAVYGASKAGVIGLTYSLSKELAGRKIRVNAIAPGVIATDMIAGTPDAKRESLLQSIGLGREGTPEDIAPTVVYLASDMSAYVTGQVIGIDGGLVI